MQREHTWLEGIQACEARSQSKTAIGQQLNGAELKHMDSSMASAATKGVVFTTSVLESRYTAYNVPITKPAQTSVEITSAIIGFPSIQASASSPIITKGCVKALEVVVLVCIVVSIIY